jgi:hypothetical protein
MQALQFMSFTLCTMDVMIRVKIITVIQTSSFMNTREFCAPTLNIYQFLNGGRLEENYISHEINRLIEHGINLIMQIRNPKSYFVSLRHKSL